MRTRGRRRPTWRRRVKLAFIYAEIMALLILAIGLGVIGGTFYSVSRILPSGPEIASYRPTEATKIISSDGVVLAEIYEENREFVPIGKIPEDLQNATVAIEDTRFFKHFGVDFIGIARALYYNLRTGRMAQGGSTLTQQLARNIYLTREKRLSRKLQEIVLALQLERNFSKQQILELYLNQVYYGSGSYGVQTASKVYFGKQVKDLTLAECALLGGLPQKPSANSPYENRDGALARRNLVLQRMADLGYITEGQRDEAKGERLRLVGRQPGGIAKWKAPWFVSHVIKRLTDKYEVDLVYKGGLRIYTSLNYEMQKVAEKELREGVREARRKNVSQGALVCIDPENGYIKAMVGGVNPDYMKDQFNRTVQAKRQPGSSFKAFVYTAAIDNGYDPNYRLSNARITFPGAGTKPWTPRNYTGRWGGTYTIKRAVAESVNVCAVRMADKIGIDQVITYARLLGIKSPLDRTLSLALGASVVTPLEMCSAYGVFAENGMRAEPIAITRITESQGDKEGALIEENRPVTHQVLSQQTAEIMNEIFHGVVYSRGGTGYAAQKVPNAHGKTGTTSNDRDAWFIGYTPELVTAVWAGNDDYSPMKGVWGGNVCAPVWTAFMLKALKVHEKESRKEEPRIAAAEDEKKERKEERRTPRQEPPQSRRMAVRICAASGLLANPDCPTTYEVSYEAGREPISRCTMHGSPTTPETPDQTSPPAQVPATTTPAPRQPTTATPRPQTTPRTSDGYVSVTICSDSGNIANTYCPETVTRRFRVDEAPSKVCRTHKPPTD